ncbi:TPA: hypothetical protein ACMDVK_004413 [Vibrio parahaemolyticus]
MNMAKRNNRCWGITKEYKLCKLKGDWLLFCGNHRKRSYWIAMFIVIFGLIGTSVTIFTPLSSHSSVPVTGDNLLSLEANDWVVSWDDMSSNMLKSQSYTVDIKVLSDKYPISFKKPASIEKINLDEKYFVIALDTAPIFLRNSTLTKRTPNFKGDSLLITLVFDPILLNVKALNYDLNLTKEKIGDITVKLVFEYENIEYSKFIDINILLE